MATPRLAPEHIASCGDIARLKELLETRINHLEEMAEERWTSHRKEHELLAKAVDEERIRVDKKHLEMNEIRSQLAVQKGEFLTKEAYDAKHEALITSTDAADKSLEARITNLEKGKAHFDGKWVVLGVIGLLITQYILTHAGAIFGGIK